MSQKANLGRNLIDLAIGFAQAKKLNAEADVLSEKKITVEMDNEIKRDTIESVKRKIHWSADLARGQANLANFKASMTKAEMSVYFDFVAKLGGEVTWDSAGPVVTFPKGVNPRLIEYQAMVASKEYQEARARLEKGTADVFAPAGGGVGARFMQTILQIVAGMLK